MGCATARPVRSSKVTRCGLSAAARGVHASVGSSSSPSEIRLRTAPPVQFAGPTLTPLTWKLIIGLAAVYVAQLVAENWLNLPISAWLAWWPLETGAFRLWQPLTAALLGGPTPLSAFLSWVMLGFLR